MKKTCNGCRSLQMNGFPNIPDLMPKCEHGFEITVRYNGEDITIRPREVCRPRKENKDG